MDELQTEAEALRGLAQRKPTPERVRIVEKALSSKWEGGQSLALQTLAQWGDRRSVELIRPFLERSFDKQDAWAIRKVAVQALAGLVGPEDAHWLKELINSRTSGLERHELRPLIDRLAELGAAR